MTASQRIKMGRVLPYFLVFLFPVLFVLIALMILQVHPFGDKSILSMDLWGQYFPMYVEQHAGGVGLFGSRFSFHGGLGFNSYAQAAYYGNSPFFLFWHLFGRDQLMDVLTWTVLLKYGLTSLFHCG